MANSLMVSVPTFDRSIKAACAEAIGNAIEHAEVNAPCELERVVHRYVSGYDVARARNEMARAALDDQVDLLWMVDSDVVVPPDALTLLLSAQLDVCMGFYVRGTDDGDLTSFVRPGTVGNDDCYRASELRELRDKGVHLAGAKRGGMGCALISTSVFRRLKRPWFVFRDYADGSGLGEDYHFCAACAERGIKLYVDTRVGCGHIHDRILEA